ncbi:MAG: helix-turn-helix transcriptional regulator [Allomuricauda sp.]|jgi:transcriptional regulator with XRE-family HTH domain
MNRLNEVISEKGITQTWLANQMNKSYNTINEYVRNKRQPSLKDLYKLATILNIEAKDLILDMKQYNAING